MALISDIRTPRRGSRLRELVVDGEVWRTTSSDVVKALKLRCGQEAVLQDLEGAVDVAEPPAARERALRMLSYRDRTANELVLRLTEDGYAGEVATDVVADLARAGFVDDARVAAVAARNLTKVRGLGRARAGRELIARGLDADLVERALGDSLSPEDELEAARRLARSLATRPGIDPGRIANRLVRKGYRQALAIRVAREAVDGTSGEWDDTTEDDAEPFGDTYSDLP